MAVRAETRARLHAVIVDDAQRTEAHVLGIVVVGEREAVIRVEPAVLGVPALACAWDFHTASLRSGLPHEHRQRSAHAVAYQRTDVAGDGISKRGVAAEIVAENRGEAEKTVGNLRCIAARVCRDRREAT